MQSYLRYLEAALLQPAMAGPGPLGFQGYNVNSKRLKASLGNIRTGAIGKPEQGQQTSLERHGFVAMEAGPKAMNKGLALMMEKLDAIEHRRKKREPLEEEEGGKRVKH